MNHGNHGNILVPVTQPLRLEHLEDGNVQGSDPRFMVIHRARDPGGLAALALGVLPIMRPGTGLLTVLWRVGFYGLFAGFMSIAMGYGLAEVAATAKTVEAPGPAPGS